MSKKKYLISIISLMTTLSFFPETTCMSKTDKSAFTNSMDSGPDTIYPIVISKPLTNSYFVHVEYSKRDKAIIDSMDKLEPNTDYAKYYNYLKSTSDLIFKIVQTAENMAPMSRSRTTVEPWRPIPFNVSIMEGGFVYNITYCLRQPEQEEKTIIAIDSMIRNEKFPDPNVFGLKHITISNVIRRR